MRTSISIGNQSFDKIRTTSSFYVDKTDFIREWWEENDDVTLITRPRRFGKTLNISMLECFFSKKYAGRSDLFEGLSIWENEHYRNLQGTLPVISLSFAGVKADRFQTARDSIIKAVANVYIAHSYLKNSPVLTKEERASFDAFQNYSIQPAPKSEIPDALLAASLNTLSMYLERHHHKKVLIFLDEYDTPLLEAYVSGYWQELTSLIRNMFNSTFKTNDYLYRAVMIGITRISKESIFSDLNNLEVITTTSKKYCTAFGFTEEEVKRALAQYSLSDKLDRVRYWYNGFCFGNRKDIYNPWSITKYLDTGKFGAYWANTSSNSLIGKFIQEGVQDVKMAMEDLLTGKTIETIIDEEIVFEQLEESSEAIWSLLLASGYLKVEQVFSFFDTGNHPSEQTEPERFYHGFVLGLIADAGLDYTITSNRESGLGRYDVIMEPNNEQLDAYVFEFKVKEPGSQNTLEETVQSALAQIDEKKYDAILIAKGISKDRIRHYGFAFEGKKVLIG